MLFRAANCEPVAQLCVTWQIHRAVKLLHNNKQFSVTSAFSIVSSNLPEAIVMLVISYSQPQHHNLCMLAHGAQQPVYSALNWQKQLELE